MIKWPTWHVKCTKKKKHVGSNNDQWTIEIVPKNEFFWLIGKGEGEEGLQDVLGIPKDGVGVEIIGGVEPEMELLLSIPFPLCEHIGVNCVRVATKVAKKLKINLIPRRSWSFKLQPRNKKNRSEINHNNQYPITK